MDRNNPKDRTIQRMARRIQKADGIKYTEALRKAQKDREIELKEMRNV